MRKRIASLLIWLAQKVYPSYESKPNYEAKEIAIAVAITKKNIRQYRNSCKEKTSYRKAIADMERIQKGNNRSHIFEAIEKNKLISDYVYTKDGNKVVESRLKVYVRKEE